MLTSGRHRDVNQATALLDGYALEAVIADMSLLRRGEIAFLRAAAILRMKGARCTAERLIDYSQNTRCPGMVDSAQG